jgi:hypothetical protein
MLRKFCEWLAKRLPSFTIPTPDGKPYLTRYYLFGADRAWGNVFLHHFHSSDMDVAPSGEYYLHNHPWPWSFSIILVNGYIEYRRMHADSADLKRKKYSPLSINILTDKDFHRVVLYNSLDNPGQVKDAWSLFFTGWRSKKRSWGFWDPFTKEYLDFKNFAKAIE